MLSPSSRPRVISCKAEYTIGLSLDGYHVWSVSKHLRYKDHIHPYVRPGDGSKRRRRVNRNPHIVAVLCLEILQRPSRGIRNDVQDRRFLRQQRLALRRSLSLGARLRRDKNFGCATRRYCPHAHGRLLGDERPDEGAERVVDGLRVRRIYIVEPDDKIAQPRRVTAWGADQSGERGVCGTKIRRERNDIRGVRTCFLRAETTQKPGWRCDRDVKICALT